jgi:undecaprenyl diphosphate synthase
MIQSTSLQPNDLPHHTAIIMDGNGRWAEARGFPRTAGHREGAVAVRRTVEAARAIGLRLLTLYAFSSDNWRRPRPEVSALWALLSSYLKDEAERLRERGIRLTVIGRRDRLPASLVDEIEAAEAATAGGRDLHLRIAVDYSAREAIARAARRLPSRSQAPCRDLSRILETPNVDLLIRTGGEQRLSDFLLWEAAYAELVFLQVAWPEFARNDLEGALAEFARRQRRFGRIRAAV